MGVVRTPEGYWLDLFKCQPLPELLRILSKEVSSYIKPVRVYWKDQTEPLPFSQKLYLGKCPDNIRAGKNLPVCQLKSTNRIQITGTPYEEQLKTLMLAMGTPLPSFPKGRRVRLAFMKMDICVSADGEVNLLPIPLENQKTQG